MPRFKALEKELMDEYLAVCAQARILLRQNRRKEAAELLTINFKKQFGKAKEFLKQELAAAAATGPSACPAAKSAK